jgi:hypothetical protein
VRNDHCFQRIVLDAICGGTWYDHIARPAYKHLTRYQALQAVTLCDAIISGDADLTQLNRQSLTWRGKLREKSVRKKKALTTPTNESGCPQRRLR